MRAKLLTMRLDPELAGAHPLAAEARGAVCETLKLLDDKETKREILTNATRRRVDEMRAKNIGDVRGGYVSATGVHYAARRGGGGGFRLQSGRRGGRSGDEPGGEDTRRRGGGGEGFRTPALESGGSDRIDEHDARAVGVGPADGTDAAAPRPVEADFGDGAKTRNRPGEHSRQAQEEKGRAAIHVAPIAYVV